MMNYLKPNEAKEDLGQLVDNLQKNIKNHIIKSYFFNIIRTWEYIVF